MTDLRERGCGPMVRRNGQSLAEYALLVVILIAAFTAIMTLVARAYKGRVFDAASKFVTDSGGTTLQYEEYYNVNNTTGTQAQNQTATLAAGGAMTTVSHSDSGTTGTRTQAGFGSMAADDGWATAK